MPGSILATLKTHHKHRQERGDFLSVNWVSAGLLAGLSGKSPDIKKQILTDFTEVCFSSVPVEITG